MADIEKVPLTRDETLAVMGIPVWYRRGGAAVAVAPEPVSALSPAEPSDTTLSEAALSKAPLSEATPAAPSDPAPAVVAGAEQAPPAASADDQAAPARLAFTWVKGASGMVLNGLVSDAALLKLLKDVVRYADWVSQSQGAGAHGDFQWPQLLDTSGTPERALGAFVAKHLPDGGWLALTPEVREQLEPWLAALDVTVIDLPALTANLGDATTKKAIWQQLKNLA